jgi:hypothetical protein
MASFIVFELEEMLLAVYNKLIQHFSTWEKQTFFVVTEIQL